MPRPNDAALAAFIAANAEIDAALERIRAASADHFFATPEDVHWGHDTGLVDHAALLKQITDVIYADGEHAHPEDSPRPRTTLTF